MTAIAPSPTAEATRLADSARTSPATKMPGTLVSRWYGIRSSSQPRGRSPAADRSGPATTNPAESRTTTPSSQSVSGAAPMNKNSREASTVSVSPLAVFRSVRPSRWSSPEAAMTSVHVRTEMFGMSSICLIR